MIDYKITTFLMLCKTMNYRKTAENLNMTQPAVTNQIQQLESIYGCKLFSYKNRVLKKTKEGIKLENYAISADYNSKKIFEELSKKEKENIKIGATRTIGEYIINNQIASLILNNDIKLTYVIDNTNNLTQKLKNGELDYIFIEGFVNKNDFSSRIYKKESLVGICSLEHPFANRVVSFDEIFRNIIIVREKGSGTREALNRILTNNNNRLNSFQGELEINSFAAITHLVSKNIGISFVYESVANSLSNIAVFNIENIDANHEFTCLYLKNQNEPLYLNYFCE